MKPLSTEEVIRRAGVVDEFLQNEVIAGILSRLERKYYEEFLASDSSEKRVTAWAKAKTLRDFEQETKAVIDGGKIELEHIARKAKRDAEI